MKRVIHKWFWVWDFEKEEKWLNDMSTRGLQLSGVGLCKYVFEEGTPGEYSYRLELLEKTPAHPESISYFLRIQE